MKLEVRRKWFTDKSLCGQLYIDGQETCYTLEPPWADGANQHKINSILPGTYKVIIDFSPHFKRRLPHILNVPYRDQIRMHVGNSAKDTEGCTLLGYTHSVDFIGQSIKAFGDFFPKLNQAINAKEETSITFTNEPS
jgi:hypothetical protein